MKYKLTEINKVRTTTGKDKADIVLDNNVKATIWGDFPNFATLEAGVDIEGDLTPAKDSRYAPTLSAPRPTTSFKPSGSIAKAQEVKGQQIKEAQERKSESIAYFNSVNSAIAMLEYEKISPIADSRTGFVSQHEKPEERIVYWRDWFLSEFDKWNSPTRKPPFNG